MLDKSSKSDAAISQSGAVGQLSHHLATAAEWEFGQLLMIARRRLRVILIGVGIGLALALVYSLSALPRYTASVSILIDTPKIKAVADSYDPASSSMSFETGGVDSQVELLKSERIVLGVIKKLELKKNPAFLPKSSAFGQAISGGYRNLMLAIGLLSPGDIDLAASEADERLERSIVGSLSKSMDVKRIGRSYVLELKYSSNNPDLAARIANGIADQYLTDSLDAKYDATTRAAVWLQDRIAELREHSLQADMKVQQFRSDNGLIAVDGKLIDDQQLTDANAQLSDARAKMADAQARAERIETIIREGKVDAAVSESLANPVVSNLRQKYFDAAKREADISKKLGPDHIAAQNLRNEMKQYERLLFEELGRIGESYRSDFQIARDRVDNLQKNFKNQLTQAASNNHTLVALRELERESETYKTLYQTFLTRYQEAIQQQTFPITDARVITAASKPMVASWPRNIVVLPAGLFVGLLFGIGAAFLLEQSDRAFRTGEQVQSELELEFLGLLPAMGTEPSRSIEVATGSNVLGEIPPFMRYSLSVPLSGFAETLRATKVAADIALRPKHPKVIGFVSVLPGEGKTTVAKNFASLVASLGSRTVLIDADMRNPGLTRRIAPHVVDGLVELLQGSRSEQEVALHEAESGLTIIPTVVHRKMTNSSELLSSGAMHRLVEQLGLEADYVILDLPPLGPVIDVRAAADLVDAFVFVVEWGKTPRSLVRSTLEIEVEVRERCLGVVLNKVDNSKMALYEGNEYRNYYYSKYSKYYTN